MRANLKKANKFRITDGYLGTSVGDGGNGAFMVVRDGVCLNVIASNARDWTEAGLPGPAWEHVSVSTRMRCPTWEEMDFVKRLFWDDDETVIQLHVPRLDHINFHKFCLHLWKPIGVEIPLPPSETIAAPV